MILASTRPARSTWPDTVADVSRVIDWGLARADGDPARIDVGGISYGAGQSLLAAAADPRIRQIEGVRAGPVDNPDLST